jgi:hypothetical protein
MKGRGQSVPEIQIELVQITAGVSMGKRIPRTTKYHVTNINI